MTDKYIGIQHLCAAAAQKYELTFALRLEWLRAQANLTEKDALTLLADHYGMQACERAELDVIEPDFEIASFADCQRRECVLGYERQGRDDGPGDQDDSHNIDATHNTEEGKRDCLVFVVTQPDMLDAHQWFESVLIDRNPTRVRRVLALKDDFSDFMLACENNLRAMDSFSLETAQSAGADAEGAVLLMLSMATIESTSNPTVRLVDSTLYDALKLGASDIHFEVNSKGMHIKYRLDGVLQSIKKIDNIDTANQVISRIKVLSDLDISERRIPQDGRFRVLLEQREIDFRVSVMPNIGAEDAVLRILDRKHLMGEFQMLTLDRLSFESPVKDFIRKASRLPYGLLLVTGPTGSGKTTTLYAALSEINTGLDKIITIEDPIEYQLGDILQIPVNEKKNLTFAKGLRSILRHDPDKIMVGEIRDAETAQIAVQAALTGHQVFTTIHANNVFDVFGRFANMGIDSYSLVAALSGILAQRLVRSVCLKCAQEVTLEEVDLSSIEQSYLYRSLQNPKGMKVKKARGCASCRDTGYRGRCAIAEILNIDDAMKDLLVQQAPISVVKKAARAQGFMSLRDSAVSLVLRGLTTIEEIDRVTPEEQVL